MVPGAIEQVMRIVVLRVPGLEERPRVEQAEGDTGQQNGGEERVRYLEAECPRLPVREQTKGSLDPPHPPIRLSRRRHLLGLERAVKPYRVDLHQATESG